MFDMDTFLENIRNGFRLVPKQGKIFMNNIYTSLPGKDKQLPTPEEVSEDIENNRNHSWIRETIGDNDLADRLFADLESGIDKVSFKAKYHDVERRQVDYLVDNVITNLDILYESFQAAKALKASGFTGDDELFVMLDRTPELVYMCGAASILGCKVNLITEKFKKEQLEDVIIYRWDERLTKEEIEEAKRIGLKPRGADYDSYLISKGYEPKKPNKKLVFFQDVKTGDITELVDDLPNVGFIEVPFNRSVRTLKTYSRYIYPYYHPDNEAVENLRERSNVITFKDFCRNKDAYTDKVENPSDLNTAFTVTYSSGTTGDPKGILHANRHYIYIGRYHAPEVSGIPNMGEMSTYSTIPAYSNSFFSSIISDNMMTKGVIKLDPVDDVDYFKIGYFINDAVLNIATVPSFMRMAISYYLQPEEFEGLPKARHQFINMTVGEELVICEKQFLQRFALDLGLFRRFCLNNGFEIMLPANYYGVCSAGGACEVGSAFIDLKNSGLKTYDFVDCMIINDEGREAAPGEWGNMTLTSKIDFVGYLGDKSATDNAYIVGPDGKKRFNLGVVSRKNLDGTYDLKTRISEPTIAEQMDFRIVDAIAKDTKNIVSVKVVKGADGDYYSYVILNPLSKDDVRVISDSARARVLKECNVVTHIVEINPIKGYPLTKSLKVDLHELARMSSELEKGKGYYLS